MCLEEEEKDKQTGHRMKKNVPLRVKILSSKPAPGCRLKEVRHCEVPCRVPEYRQPQPKAQANARWP